MVNTIDIAEFLQKAKELPVLDVRAPKEFTEGHIPQAHSFPIFLDEERAVVGTAYKQQGHDPAVLLGLDLFGPKMSGFVRQAKKLAKNKELLVHCWRGGMRSSAMAWLLNFSGYKVHLLKGGYKAYRHLIQEQFTQPRPLLVLGGLTGSGKTDLLPYLQAMGQQVIDLEKLASHKGSAFGSIGMPPQPSTEHFENLLGTELLQLHTQQPLWLEDENITVGKVMVPKPLYDQMQRSPTIVLQVPDKLRVQKLAQEYCKTDEAVLAAAVLKIKKRLGGLATKEALAAIAEGDMEKMVELVLTYYDKAYTFQLNKKEHVLPLELPGLDPEENAARVLQFVQQQKLVQAWKKRPYKT
ncbi:tRNA 2-selenouridine synthase [Pontibacter ummariensis]|uniref:tRNA 2-selenouridine synthase n=1 Tax=Pontibacter ummariensis TaxID=1610492 RepID=A0A239K883_9BACT|nr:tRNA 2-selenouridine(34) synthase MnmH [Pontibacter ummariensis]PRY06034.1 tRNA 2-selenouridine synthase [Pontibacter ummariensis]SNT14170.1 tRNA 2-selenouridine synthase [Pontibacter ummariensis]